MNTSADELVTIEKELEWSAYVMRRANSQAVDMHFAMKRLELLKERALLLKLEGEK